MNDEMLKHLNAAADGVLTDAEARRLSDLLSDAKSTEKFYALMQVHLGLAESSSPIRDFSIEELRAVSDVDARFEATVAARSEAVSHAASSLEHRRRTRVGSQWMWFFGGLAASALLFAAHSLQFGGLRTAEGPSAAPTPTGEDAIALHEAARIVKKIDCIWDSDRWMVESPTSFRAGEPINLSSGLLVLEFRSGAQVTLQGPTSASPLSGNSISLTSGGLTANVPEEAKGFTVHTLSGEVIDLGTRFGVMASSSGSVETHVFEGEVVTRLHANETGPELHEVSLLAGEAQLVSATGAAESAAADPSRFIRLDFGRDGRELLLPPPASNLSLWLAADGRLQLDDDSRVMAWGDNETASNTSVEDTWQIRGNKRPVWKSDAINGRPALEFGGNRVLVSEPLELGSSVTSSVVFRLDSSRVEPQFRRMRNAKIPRPERLGNLDNRPDLGLQLLNLYGPPHTVVQIEEDASLRARVHLGWNRRRVQGNDTGVVQTSPLLDDAAHVVVYSVDSSERVARLFLDGVLVSEQPCEQAMRRTFTSRTIGQHPYRPLHGFPGCIAEVLIYDRALETEEAMTLSQWLGHKYDIPIGSD